MQLTLGHIPQGFDLPNFLPEISGQGVDSLLTLNTEQRPNNVHKSISDQLVQHTHHLRRRQIHYLAAVLDILCSQALTQVRQKLDFRTGQVHFLRQHVIDFPGLLVQISVAQKLETINDLEDVLFF